ncbi:hypothetical protein C0992_008186 [Termitomyces sp. T32_za158]|nr:hypothetical protein C0992_008186 [Termitomyces sp. T32_za158]
MLQQHNDNTIKTFATALKRRPTSPEDQAEAKRLRVSGAIGPPTSGEKDSVGPSSVSAARQRQKEAREITPMPAELLNELVVVDASLQGLSLSAHAPVPSVGPTTKADEVEVYPTVFEADVPKGSDRSSLNFVAAVQFEAPLSEYRSVIPPVDTRSKDNVEGQLPTLASLGLEEPSDVSDYGEQSEETPSEGETPANRRLRLARNKKKSARSAHEAARQKKAEQDRQEQATGHIPDGLGVFVDGMVVERSNWFFGGALDRHFYYSHRTNAVFVSDEAISTKMFEEEKEERYYHTSPEMGRVAPKGFPMNPQQLRKLRELALTHGKLMVICTEAYYLMCEFQRISMNYYPALRDRTMALVCTPEYEHLPPPLSLSSRHMNLAVMPTPDGYLRWKDRAGRPFFTLAGFDSEGVRYTFDLDRLAKIVLYFSQPEMQNSVLGIAVDYAYRIHWRTLLGHALTRGLAPAGRARRRFARLLALILARPGLYREAIADYNVANPLTPFSPMSWTDIQLRAPHFEATAAVNITDADVICTMLANGIPVEWVDHAYTFGVVYLETHFFEVNASIDLYQEIDDERHRRLKQYGEPPAILQWDGWRVPTEGDMIRLHALLVREHTQGHIYAEKGLYYPIGMDPNRTHLWQQLERHGPLPVTPENPSATPHASIASMPHAPEPSTLSVNVNTEMRIDLASELARLPSA